MTSPIDWPTRLQDDGFLEAAGSGLHTTKRWQAAMSRAALRLHVEGESLIDLRIPITVALLETYGDVTEEALADAVAIMLRIESAELSAQIAKLG